MVQVDVYVVGVVDQVDYCQYVVLGQVLGVYELGVVKLGVLDQWYQGVQNLVVVGVVFQLGYYFFWWVVGVFVDQYVQYWYGQVVECQWQLQYQCVVVGGEIECWVYEYDGWYEQ